jgi:diphthamide biosynthesis methyltransferase
MGRIVFVGLGLHDDYGISLSGLEEVREADRVFAEFYTNLLPDFSLRRFERVSGRNLFCYPEETLKTRMEEMLETTWSKESLQRQVAELKKTDPERASRFEGVTITSQHTLSIKTSA